MEGISGSNSVPHLKGYRFGNLQGIKQKLSFVGAPWPYPISSPSLSPEGRKIASTPELSLSGTNAVIRIAAGKLSSLTSPTFETACIYILGAV